MMPGVNMPAKKKAKKTTKKSSEDFEEGLPRTQSVSRRKDCPDCASMNIVFEPENEQLICQDCGSIFHELPAHLERSYDDIDLF